MPNATFAAAGRIARAAAAAVVLPLVLPAQQTHAVHPPRGAITPARGAVPAVVTITARNYAFDAPDTVAAGVTTIRLRNEGPELHHVWLVRLDGGKTIADFRRALQAGGPPPAWAVDAGGPNTPMPGKESNATVALQPGTYIISCFIPSADGKLHAMKGMFRELTVVAGTSRATFAPADAELSLFDYNFTFSKPLTAGTHTIRITNAAMQPHEAVLVRLERGKTLQDLLGWLMKGMQGPAAGEFVGGIVGIAKGGETTITVDLTAGDYALLCFVPDAKDGKPHVEHGMVKQFAVAK
jgi:uncharacterized cupredoxin-like copper-binding protein